VVLWRERKERGYTGGYTAVKDFVRPRRREAPIVAVRRFETPPGQQAQVDWGDLGDITDQDGTRQKRNGFVRTLGYSRAMFFDIATDQKLPSFLRLHEAAFEYLGGVPKEILSDNPKTVVLKALTQGGSLAAKSPSPPPSLTSLATGGLFRVCVGPTVRKPRARSRTASGTYARTSSVAETLADGTI